MNIRMYKMILLSIALGVIMPAHAVWYDALRPSSLRRKLAVVPWKKVAVGIGVLGAAYYVWKYAHARHDDYAPIAPDDARHDHDILPGEQLPANESSDIARSTKNQESEPRPESLAPNLLPPPAVNEMANDIAAVEAMIQRARNVTLLDNIHERKKAYEQLQHEIEHHFEQLDNARQNVYVRIKRYRDTLYEDLMQEYASNFSGLPFGIHEIDAILGIATAPMSARGVQDHIKQHESIIRDRLQTQFPGCASTKKDPIRQITYAFGCEEQKRLFDALRAGKQTVDAFRLPKSSNGQVHDEELFGNIIMNKAILDELQTDVKQKLCEMERPISTPLERSFEQSCVIIPRSPSSPDVRSPTNSFVDFDANSESRQLLPPAAIMPSDSIARQFRDNEYRIRAGKALFEQLQAPDYTADYKRLMALPNVRNEKENRDILDGIINLVWYFYSNAVNKGQAFSEGTFVIHDRDFRIYKFLMKYMHMRGGERTGMFRTWKPFVYQRPSTHFTEQQKTFKHYGIDIRFTERDYELPLLPAHKRHILFGKLDENEQLIFIKPENHGLYTDGLWGHIKETGMAQGRRLLPQYFGSNDDPCNRKERVPKVVLDAFGIALMASNIPKQSEIALRARVEKHGIKELYKIQREYEADTHFTYGIQQMLNLLRQEGYDHLELRTGREVILTHQELLARSRV